MAYCDLGEQQPDDKRISFAQFDAWIDAPSEPYLVDASVDYREDRMGGQLTIRAPNAIVPNVDSSSSLEERINYVLYNEVNPMLSQHGGFVRLVGIADETVAIVQFGGGCQGCAAIDITLKKGVRESLLTRVSELTDVRDDTDHTVTDGAYFQA